MLNYFTYGNIDSSHHMFYFHGGGFIIGSALDLPSKTIKTITDFGICIHAIEYPLAPPSSLNEITKASFEIIRTILSINTQIETYSLFGRSAGSALSFEIIAEYQSIQPLFIVSYYGYIISLNNEWMHKKVRTPLQENIDLNLPYATRRLASESYKIYYQIRALGQWFDILRISYIKQFPIFYTPVFMIHSIFDQDVPYMCSSQIKKHFPNFTIKTYNSKKHEIDEDIDFEEIIRKELSDFLYRFKSYF